jgi:hypothetical protein
VLPRGPHAKRPRVLGSNKNDTAWELEHRSRQCRTSPHGILRHDPGENGTHRRVGRTPTPSPMFPKTPQGNQRITASLSLDATRRAPSPSPSAASPGRNSQTQRPMKDFLQGRPLAGGTSNRRGGIPVSTPLPPINSPHIHPDSINLSGIDLELQPAPDSITGSSDVAESQVEVVPDSEGRIGHIIVTCSCGKNHPAMQLLSCGSPRSGAKLP